jgi:hypothetical protein
MPVCDAGTPVWKAKNKKNVCSASASTSARKTLVRRAGGFVARSH